MNEILEILGEEDDMNFVALGKNPKRKNNKKVDDLKVKPLFDDGDDYVDAPHPNLLRIPFSLLLIAPKGSGKTTTLQNVLMWYDKMFDAVFIFSPTVKLDKKWEQIIKKLKIPDQNLFEKCREEEVSNLIQQIKDANESLSQRKKIRTLLIFDDCVELLPKSKKVSFINRLAMNHRHYFISHIIVSQSFKKLDPVVRLNTTGTILFNCDNIAERRKIFEELAGNIGIRRFEELYMDVVSEKFSFLYLNYDTRKVFRNFDEEIADLAAPPTESAFAIKSGGGMKAIKGSKSEKSDD